MSSKIQANCFPNNVWVNIIKNHWKINQSISKHIQHLEDTLRLEQAYLLRLQLDNQEYNEQTIKIFRLIEGIRKYKRARSRNLETINYVSSILTKTTC